MSCPRHAMSAIGHCQVNCALTVEQLTLDRPPAELSVPAESPARDRDAESWTAPQALPRCNTEGLKASRGRVHRSSDATCVSLALLGFQVELHQFTAT